MNNELNLLLFRREVNRLREEYKNCEKELIKSEIHSDIILLSDAIKVDYKVNR
ncbi:hypothetical protein IHQ11_23440 [Priestia megaterium]|uniref:hypothetical protein n=1 Tax=Priestia megaterium TaxID=1404 RepID=UPI001B39F9A7|nr:hypothetical protein [Priestia megaterium]MBQ4869426.1 hypothetical protein [Priestia megaterium]MEB2277453.1 hypothetical protein [Bacillus sp. ILBB4]